MPDGRFSLVRFEVLAFFHKPSHLRRGSSAGSHTPRLCGLPTASFHHMRRLIASSVSGPALPMKPPSTQSPFAQGRCYLPWGDVIRLLRGHCSPFFAPMDSCADPVGSPFLRFFTSFQKSWQVATSPCCQRHLPDSISANLSPDAWSPATTVPPSALTCFFLDVIGLPQDTMGRLPVFIRECDFPAG
jgi:hypothetical protein